MAKNENLHKAKDAKNDEFYTLLSSVSEELRHYKQHFADKIVLCNCDDPTWSAFWRYFHLNFSELGLKKLIATHYDRTEPTYKMEYEGGDDNDAEVGVKTPLEGNGDFRSEECLALLDECDIIVTNEWIDTSAHNAPPPDFYSDKYGLMMDVMKIEDNTRKGKKGKLYNPKAEKESQVYRKFKNAGVITSETQDVVINAVTDLPTMEDHQFKWYFDSFERVVSSHNNKIPLYQQNHENFKTIFFVYDESTAYTQLLAGQTYIIPEKGQINYVSPSQLHFYAHDIKFQSIIKNSDADYMIWYAPYKYYDKLSDGFRRLKQPIYRAAIIDVKALKSGKSHSKNYIHGLMISAEE